MEGPGVYEPDAGAAIHLRTHIHQTSGQEAAGSGKAGRLYSGVLPCTHYDSRRPSTR